MATVKTLAALLATMPTGGDFTALELQDMLVSVYPTVVVKTATESVASSTTLQDDDELKFTGRAGVTYALLAVLVVDGHVSGDLKANWNVPADADSSGPNGVFGVGTTATTFESATVNNQVGFADIGSSTGRPAGVLGVNAWALALVVGSVVMGAEGEVALAWAQQATNVTATRVGAGSFLIAIPANS